MSLLPSPSVAAVLSFLFPGAGQVYAGYTARGVVWSIPMVAFVLSVLYTISGGLDPAELFADPLTMAVLLVLNLAFFFYHLASVFDAYGLAQRERRMERINMPAGAPLVLAGLVAAAVLLHGIPEAVGLSSSHLLERAFWAAPST
jgi:hypothetical protein